MIEKSRRAGGREQMAAGRGHARKPDRSGDSRAMVADAVSRKLKDHYDALSNERLPDPLMDLLNRLEAME